MFCTLQSQVVFTSYIDFVCFKRFEWPLTVCFATVVDSFSTNLPPVAVD